MKCPPSFPDQRFFFRAGNSSYRKLLLRKASRNAWHFALAGQTKLSGAKNRIQYAKSSEKDSLEEIFRLFGLFVCFIRSCLPNR